MSIYITGDTHGSFSDMRFFPYGNNLDKLTENDYLIICGDFGFDWNEEIQKKWNTTSRKYTTLFCAGNHENYDILNSLPKTKMFDNEVGVFGDNTYYLLTGHMYIIDGKKFFIYGGSASIDKDWRILEEMKSNTPRTLWWPEEVPSREQFELAQQTLKDNNYTFDYFITHTCRPVLKGYVLQSYKVDFYDQTESDIAELEELIKDNNGSYRAHFFGHFHCDVHFEKEHCLYTSVVNITDNYYFKTGACSYKFYENEDDNPDHDYSVMDESIVERDKFLLGDEE